MTELERLIDDGADDFERQVLASAARDVPDAARKAAMIAELDALTIAPLGALPATVAARWSAARWLAGLLSAGLVAGLFTMLRTGPASSPPKRPVRMVLPAPIEAPAAPPGSRQPAAVTAVPTLAPTAVPALAPPASASAAADARSGAPASKGSAERETGLAAEVAWLDSVRTALTLSRNGQALELLNRYPSRFPRGSLTQEATLLRIQTLLASGDRHGAQRLGRKFLINNPGSAHAKRVATLLNFEAP